MIHHGEEDSFKQGKVDDNNLHLHDLPTFEMEAGQDENAPQNKKIGSIKLAVIIFFAVSGAFVYTRAWICMHSSRALGALISSKMCA